MTEALRYISPVLYALTRKDLERDKHIYGDGDGKTFTATAVAVAVGILLLSILLWVYPMIKAFTCPYNGIVWGLLIFFFPFLGIIYLFVGCNPPPQSTQQPS